MDILAGQRKNKYGSSILNSIDPNISYNSTQGSSGDSPICNGGMEGLSSLNLCEDIDDHGSKSVLLLDDRERMRVSSEENFLKLLKITPKNKKVKVVSIFGNTGEGKSYTLNKVFFNGEEVFRTSSSQASCTLGVWAMYNPKLNVICLDTEGLLGVSTKEHQRTRVLLKVLAVSDIIIYRTKAERLQRDMYTFLSGASVAYKKHFSGALKKILSKSDSENIMSGFGPGVIIFHETRHTDTLHASASVTQSVEDILQCTFTDLTLSYDAFSFIKYVGSKTTNNSETSFKEFSNVLLEKLESTEVRSPRDAKYVYLTLKSLNEKFQNKISDAPPQLYQSTFFTCHEKCLSCKNGCVLSMGHKDEGEAHHCDKNCRFQHQFQNYVYLCKACHKNGQNIVVTPSDQPPTESFLSNYLTYVWSGYTIDCPKCGTIYRSRQHWYGNKNPEDGAVRLEIVHIWPGEKSLLGCQNYAQKIVDGATIISDVISSVAAEPTKKIKDWAADTIAPKYWVPNEKIKECHKCQKPFALTDEKHHCRACGEGFCGDCSSHRQPVPSRGWSTDERVCDYCYKESPPSLTDVADGTENRARIIGETVVNSISVVKYAVDVSKEYLKSKAKPTYWTPDSECINCAVCEKPFGLLLLIHHCRDCGKGVCENCSKSRKPVPLQGWTSPVRVCDNCC